MPTQLHQTQTAFRDAQVIGALSSLRHVDVAALTDDARDAVQTAMRVLSSHGPQGGAPSADVGYRAQKAAEEHLAACQEALYAEEECEVENLPDSPAVGPFCGCETCVVREALFAAWPVFEADVAAAEVLGK